MTETDWLVISGFIIIGVLAIIEGLRAMHKTEEEFWKDWKARRGMDDDTL